MESEAPPPIAPLPPPEKPKEKWDAGQRTVRVGKWVRKPSKEAKAFVTAYLTDFFKTEKVWHRLEHGVYVVSVKENADNTAIVEEFRFNRTMEQRFRFNEVRKKVEVELRPL